ncbi:MAG: hypothetical protein HQK56_20090 [Deltaproteobacteria bacterium]|nr:hypothetical protein [Deltaproteobacteria bacterium]
MKVANCYIDGTMMDATCKPTSTKGSNGADFKALLDSKIPRSSDGSYSVTSSNTNTFDGTHSIYGATSIIPSNTTDVDKTGIARLEKVFGSMETYKQALEDPKVAAKDMAPIVQSLEDDINEMAKSMNNLSGTRLENLKTIMASTAKVGWYEIERYKQGVYT